MTTTIPFSSSIIDQVKLNLIHYNLWNEVNIHENDGYSYLSGKPREKLINTDNEIKKNGLFLNYLKIQNYLFKK